MVFSNLGTEIGSVHRALLCSKNAVAVRSNDERLGGGSWLDLVPAASQADLLEIGGSIGWRFLLGNHASHATRSFCPRKRKCQNGSPAGSTACFDGVFRTASRLYFGQRAWWATWK